MDSLILKPIVLVGTFDNFCAGWEVVFQWMKICKTANISAYMLGYDAGKNNASKAPDFMLRKEISSRICMVFCHESDKHES